MVQSVALDDSPQSLLATMESIGAAFVIAKTRVARDGAPVYLSHVLCCVSGGQVGKRPIGWARLLAKVGDTSEYLSGLFLPTAANHV